MEGLRPATAYALRLAAVNAIGDSDYSDPVIVQTLEEGGQNYTQESFYSRRAVGGKLFKNNF